MYSFICTFNLTTGTMVSTNLLLLDSRIDLGFVVVNNKLTKPGCRWFELWSVYPGHGLNTKQDIYLYSIPWWSQADVVILGTVLLNNTRLQQYIIGYNILQLM